MFAEADRSDGSRHRHAVVVEAIEGEESPRTCSGRIRQHGVEEPIVFQLPVGKTRKRRFATQIVRRIEMRALGVNAESKKRQMATEEADAVALHRL